MTDKQIIDEERMFECVWCKYGFKESDANFILSENPNECVCSGCITEWADNLLCDLKRKEQECEELKKRVKGEIHLGNRYKEDFVEQFNEAEKLKQTLTEIKEIAYAHKKDESVWNPYRQLDKILQKISECEGKDETN